MKKSGLRKAFEEFVAYGKHKGLPGIDALKQGGLFSKGTLRYWKHILEGHNKKGA